MNSKEPGLKGLWPASTPPRTRKTRPVSFKQLGSCLKSLEDQLVALQKKSETYRQKIEELQKQIKDKEVPDGFIDCQVEPVEPRTEETALPSGTQFSSYLDNLFGENGTSDKQLRFAAEKKLVSVENVLSAVTKIPVEETSLFLFLELPKLLLELVRGDLVDLAEVSQEYQGWKQRILEESRVCCSLARLSMKELNDKIIDLTKKIGQLQLNFKQLVGERLVFGQEKLQSLERPVHDLPDHLKANLFEQKHSGEVTRQPLRRSSSQGERNDDPKDALSRTVHVRLGVV